MKQNMTKFLHMKYPGIQDKLGWYYNESVARSKAFNRKQLYGNRIEIKLRSKFILGFAKLYRFRNDLSHGVINRYATSCSEAEKLRYQAKDIVEELFNIA